MVFVPNSTRLAGWTERSAPGSSRNAIITSDYDAFYVIYCCQVTLLFRFVCEIDLFVYSEVGEKM